MKSYKVYINGRWVPAEKAQISVFDGAYLYGEGIFETLVAQEGNIPFLRDHLQRLHRGVRALGIRLPLSSQELAGAIRRTLQVNRLSDAYIRVNVSAEEAALGRRKRTASDTHLVIIVKPPDPYPKRLYRDGAHLVIIRDLINDPLSVAEIKTTNYLIKMLGRRQVAIRKADEGILLNGKGNVTECTSSNLFLIKNGVLRTPALREGLMPGVTRKHVMVLARRQRIRVQESALSLRQVAAADEIFITSTLKGIMPVSRLERRRIGTAIPGPLTQRLMDAYATLLETNSSRKDLAF